MGAGDKSQDLCYFFLQKKGQSFPSDLNGLPWNYHPHRVSHLTSDLVRLPSVKTVD